MTWRGEHFGGLMALWRKTRAASLTIAQFFPSTSGSASEIPSGIAKAVNKPPAEEAPQLNGPDPKFQGVLLRWPVSRSTRTFRIFVAEPREYRPSAHKDVFNSTLTSLLNLDSQPIDPYGISVPSPPPEPFDLATFPEAFLPQDALIDTLKQLSAFDHLGCVHVGLRPTDQEPHLFRVSELKALVEAISEVPRIELSDLEAFSRWLGRQSHDHPFNVGCLFMIDAESRLRVCLHPKIVRSKDETSPLPESHMKEADLLTLVTLVPQDRTLMSITLQPLLCSDVLHFPTDRPGCWPLEALSSELDYFGGNLPENIDIVSVATCTPQQKRPTAKQFPDLTWHQTFRKSFIRAAGDDELRRHHKSAFIMSNFTILPGARLAGLSGAFIPTPLCGNHRPQFVNIASWGKKMLGMDNEWSWPSDAIAGTELETSRFHLASLNPATMSETSVVSVLGFTLQRFPRDTLPWEMTESLVSFQLRTGTIDPNTKKIAFRMENP